MSAHVGPSRYVALATVCELGALALLLAAPAAWLAWALPLSLLAHGAAALAAARAARRRAPTTRAEQDLVLVVAFGLPVIGPLFAWLVPRPAHTESLPDAHEVFEATRGSRQPARLPLSGDWSADVRARLDVESHLDVLRFGDRTLRANLVHKLAERGTPRDLALLRRVLEDPEEELRIQAFLHLREARNVHIEAVGALRVTAEGTGDPSAWLAAARGHLQFAESGALDPALVRFELVRALEATRRIQALELRREALALELRILGRLGCKAEAEQTLAALGEDLDSVLLEMPDVLIAWAEVAFRAADLTAVRSAARVLERTGAAVPEWMVALRVAEASASSSVSEEAALVH
ncbi:MAG: hypothetical protein R3F49_19700 [Planctomycetota bacterium]